jgi:Protein of unknown function (DUF2442)
MTDILHILSADVVADGILKITWDDNCAGLVDLRPIIARGKVFIPLQDPEYFKTVRVAPYGHSIYWGEEDDETVDFGCDRLRALAAELKPIPSRHP